MIFNDNTNLKLSPDSAVDELSSGVHLHLAVHQSHGAGQRLLVLVSDLQDTGPGSSQAVGVILPDIVFTLLIQSSNKKYRVSQKKQSRRFMAHL